MFTNMSKITGSQTKKTVYDSKVFWQALTVPGLELRLFEGSFGFANAIVIRLPKIAEQYESLHTASNNPKWLSKMLILVRFLQANRSLRRLSLP